MTATTASATCLLLVGDRVVLRASGPPEAEYAMFDSAEIELRASEPKRVREHGYQTTAEQARDRLTHFGMTSAVAREFAQAMQPVLSDAYSRGAAVRRVARYLGPAELLQADGYDAAQRAYRGVFLDLATLARDLELDHVGATLQALYLATLLESEPADTTVLLSTDAWTKGGKPGARTYKRPSFTDMQRLQNAVGGLSHKQPRPLIEEALPRADVIAFLRSRAETAPDEDARALYRSLEGSVSVRDMPDKGPLASPDLWAIETRLDGRELDGILDAVDEVERRYGRTPGTTYLRARASLAMRLEAPKLIAERISALALSMTSFQELALLAAEAWLEAGDPRRAMPYARDLVDATGVDEGLLLRAQRLLARAVGAAPQKKRQTLVDVFSAAPQPSRPPMAAAEPIPLAADNAPLEPSPRPSLDMPQTETDAAHALQPEELVPVLPTPPPPPPLASSPAPPPVPPPLPPPARPSRGVPPPLPSSRPGRAAPPAPSSRRLPTAAPAPPPLDVGNGRDLPPIPVLPVGPEARSSRRLPAAPAVPPPSERSISVRRPLEGASIELAPPPPRAASPESTERPSSIPPLRSKPAAAEMLPQAPPPPLELDLPPADPAASFTLDLPGPDTLQPVVPSVTPAAPGSSPPDQPKPARRPRLSGVMMETRPPASFDPRAEPDSPVVPRSAISEPRKITPMPEPRPAPARRPSAAALAASRPPTEQKTAHERPTPMRPPSNEAKALSIPPPFDPASVEETPAVHVPPLEPSAESPAPTPSPAPPPPASAPATSSLLPPPEARSFMHGASLPPYRHESPAPLLPKAPLLPRLGGAADELAEHLALPPGIGAEPRSLDVLPTSVLEARIQFTLLSRELGLDYRLKRGIDLRADVSGIEAMQAVLLESFPDRIVKSSDDAYELRRHGALLSEILARRLDAEWLDISPNELGYWVMIVPPDTRVWPFGRVARLVAMGHKERDLVSYYFELQARARGR